MRRKTTEEFIEEAKRVHGNKYDYSKVVYMGNKMDIKIICPTHGEFSQQSSSHIVGYGCPKCGKSYKPTTKEFIERARKVHGNKYDYSKVVYKNAKTKIIIICKEHGEFYRTPDIHLAKSGCPKCIVKKRKEEFIKKAKKIHGEKYNYSKIEYINNQTEVKIICPIHRDFYQTPSHHLCSYGCSECSKNKNKITQKEFIKRIKKVHGEKYDYSKTTYNGIYEKITIICKRHGEFTQTAKSHLRGNGCSKCSKRYRPNTKEFIEQARKFHGDRYDYSKTKYKTSNKKIIIICKRHGEFYQTPGNHLAGKGCRKCSNLKSQEQFIKDAKKVHGNRYDYSKIKYINYKIKIKIICKHHGEFYQTPIKHLRGNNCPKCRGSVSQISQKWLDKQGVPNNCREITIICGKKKYIVDGYIKETNTIYEFNGDYWHGNPNIFNPKEVNLNCKKTFGQLYKETLRKKQKLISAGYKVVDIWESDFKEMVKYEE